MKPVTLYVWGLVLTHPYPGYGRDAAVAMQKQVCSNKVTAGSYQQAGATVKLLQSDPQVGDALLRGQFTNGKDLLRIPGFVHFLHQCDLK